MNVCDKLECSQPSFYSLFVSKVAAYPSGAYAYAHFEDRLLALTVVNIGQG